MISTLAEPGGAERVAVTMANDWVSRGRPVTIVCQDRPGTASFYALAPEIQLVQVGGRAAASTALRHVAAVFIPVGAAIAVLAPLVVNALYRRGAFDAEASVRTAGVVAALLAPLLPLLMATTVLVAAHNARRRGALVGAAAILNAVLNLGLNLALAPVIGVAGVALSTSLTLTIAVLFLAWRLAVNEPGFDARSLGAVVLKSAIATAAAAIPIAYLAWGGLVSGALPAGVAWIAGLALAGSAVHLVGAAALGFREPGTVLAAVFGAVRRRRIDGR